MLLLTADAFAIHQACLQWLRSMLHSTPRIVTIHLPHSNSDAKTPSTDQHQENMQPNKPQAADERDEPCQHAAIVCQAASEVMELSQELHHPLLCSCHAQPVLQAYQQAPHQYAGCSVTGSCLSEAQTSTNDSMVQVCVLLALDCCLHGTLSVCQRSVVACA